MIGSIWNKWDLHIHSPLTTINNQYKGCTIDDFTDEVIKNDIKLLGITNYWFLEDNELEILKECFAKKSYGVTLLANVEFRIAQPNKEGEWINIHAIFSEKIKTESINKALEKIRLENTTNDGKTIWCCKQSMQSSGIKFHEAVINHEKLIDGLNETFSLGKDYFIAICPNGYGGFQPERKEGRSVAIAKEIDKLGHIILGRERDRDFFLKQDRYENASQKPVFLCSDSHKINEIGTKYTWVKAKPSFQGLRQTLFEPAERVQQSDSFTEKTLIKTFFSRIDLSGEIFSGSEIKFTKQSIPLNKNMVSIIGGRGTGKSIFLDSLRAILSESPLEKRSRNINCTEISVILDKGYGEESAIAFNSENQSPYSYLHVSQGDIMDATLDPLRLSAEIKEMLGIRKKDFDPIVTQTISENLSRYRSFIDYWCEKDLEGNSINTPNYQDKIIESNQKLIDTLTNQKNKTLIGEYQKNTEDLNKLNSSLLKTQELISFTERKYEEINQMVSSYNTLDGLPKKSLLVNIREFITPLSENIAFITSEVSKCSAKNEFIKEEFSKQGINQDISSLLYKVAEYQLKIDNAKEKKSEINLKTERYREYVSQRSELALKYDDFISEEHESINLAFQALKGNNPNWNSEQNEIVQNILSDISITGEIYFDLDKFYKGLESCINRGKFRATSEKNTIERFLETFNVKDKKDFFSLIRGDKIISIDGAKENINIEGFFWKSEYFNQGGRYDLMHYLFAPEKIKEYLYVNAIFTYKGNTIDRLSVGQRGTFYVSLKLATDPFGSPFIFDQPEDDLDNDFIMKQLVPLFKSIKKYRQVIIVTHNANLVINSDSEQIIVARNDGNFISYEMGAIEDGDIKSQVGIRHQICSILEGGHIAFSSRERKYGIL